MINQEWVESLRAVIGADKLLLGEDIGADYTHDEYPGQSFIPEAVVEAGSTEQVSAVLAICHEAGVPVTVRGAGTGQVGGSVPVQGGIVLSVKGMNAVLGLDAGQHTITVQPGVLLQNVKAEADKAGLYYPPDPGELTSTIGGNAATNAAGPCAVKYGSTRDYVLDFTFVKADGSVCRLNDDAANAAILGSEGTLGVITELTLKLIDKPGADAILLFPFLDSETAIRAAGTILSAGYDPAVVEYMDTDLVEFSGKVTGNPVFPVELDGERVAATLMVTIEAEDDDLVMEKMEQIAEMAEELECLDILVGDSPTMKREFWAAHTAFHTSMESGFKSAWEANVELPMGAMAEMINFAKETARACGMQALIHAHVGSNGMHIHLGSEKTRGEAAEDAAPALGAIYEKVKSLGGRIDGEYGVGYAKIPYQSAEDSAVFAAHKALFDPEGILNPGKVAGEGVAPTAVSTAAATAATAVKKAAPTGEENGKTAPATEKMAAAGTLKILCCVKQVPDVDQMRMDPETGNLIRNGVPAILNPQDANALSAAMKVKETYGGEITLITMGPPNAEAVLRECLAVGADKAVLVTDRAFGNADTLATSYSILSAANTQDKYDMIFCGKESLDGATGQMGAQLAQRFDMAQVTSTLLIREVDEAAGTVVVDRELENGVETLEVRLPCLFTMEKVNYPARLPSMKGKMAAKKKEIITITSNDIPELDRSRIGDPGSPTKVPRMFPPVLPEPGVILDEGSVENTVEKLLSIIKG